MIYPSCPVHVVQYKTVLNHTPSRLSPVQAVTGLYQVERNSDFSAHSWMLMCSYGTKESDGGVTINSMNGASVCALFLRATGIFRI